MQLVFPFAVVGILLIANLATKAVTIEQHVEAGNKPTLSVSPTPDTNITETPTLHATQTPNHTPTTTPETPTPTTHSSTPDASLNVVYPNSHVISESGDEKNLESADDTTQITNWYKDLIRNNDMNATSFVTTNTNGNFLNKLAGANSSKKIEVEIERKEGQNTTKIKIKLSSS